MKPIYRSYVCCLLLVGYVFPFNAFSMNSATVISPDKNIIFNLFLKEGGLYFNIKAAGNVIIENSPLDFTVNTSSILNGVSIFRSTPYHINETYPWYGSHNSIVNQANGLKVELRNTDLADSTIMIDIRVTNSAASYRFIVDGPPNQKRIPDENSIFTLPKGSYIWYHDLKMHYESIYKQSLIDTLQKSSWIAPVATLKLPNNYYAAITEANLKSYSGMALQSAGGRKLRVRLAHHQPTSYPYELRYSKEDVLRLDSPAVITGKITTPWRVVLIAKDLNDLVNNDDVFNLNPPPDKKLFPQGIATEWIKPGIAVWKYLDGGGENTVTNMKAFSKKASELGFTYNILEGFWSKWTDEEILDLVNYSKNLNVNIFVWVHSKNLRDHAKRLQLFQRCHRLGIAGLKIDFFDHEAKEVIDLYRHILEETASYKLLVDFHGANKPTGGSRTWPNELTREAIKGMEASKLEDRATHQVTLPFTRFVIGPAEYTPLHFGERKKNTTWVNQIASAAILSAPLLTYAALPQDIINNPGVEILKNIPATWDETIVLAPSEIGKIAVFARRKNNTWFVAAMNGTKTQKINIPLLFLGKSSYQALLYFDDGNENLKEERKRLTKTDVLSIELKPGGGFITELNKL